MALKNFSVEFAPGATGLLGPNGAGKTTLIKTLLGFIKPASGSGRVLDFDIATDGRQIRQKVGLMPEQDCHIPGMSAVKFVAYAGELAGMPGEQAIRRAHEVLEYCGLGEARYRNVETYSTGMKQRIKLAQALVHGPSLLLLDEPTNGLDPAGREDMLELIRSVSHGKNISVIVSSHLLKDIERVCDRVVVVMRGELRTSGAIKDLKRIGGHPVDVELRDPSPTFLQEAANRNVLPVSPEDNTSPNGLPSALSVVGGNETGIAFRLQGEGEPHEVLSRLFAAAVASGTQIRSFRVAERSLEEAFLEAIS